MKMQSSHIYKHFFPLYILVIKNPKCPLLPSEKLHIWYGLSERKVLSLVYTVFFIFYIFFLLHANWKMLSVCDIISKAAVCYIKGAKLCLAYILDGKRK